MKCKVIMIASEFVFCELAEAISISLRDLGYNASVTTNERDIADMNIVIRAFRKFEPNKNKINIVFQTEELHNRREKGIYDMVGGCTRSLEMYEENTLIPIGTKNVSYCPIGYSKAFEFDMPAIKEDIDVYFYGSLTPRRKDMLASFKNVGIDIYGETEVYGYNRNIKIMRSKIIVNMKAHDTWFYAPLHCLLVQCNKKFMMCEKTSGGYGPYIPGKHFIEFDCVEDGKEKMKWWLSHDKERHEFAVNAYEDIKKNIVFTDYIRKGLEGII